MLEQINVWGKNKIEVSIDRLKQFEPAEGYYLAFSGGKDSEVIKELAIMAGVKFEAHYNLTTVDPPELVNHIKENHKDVKIDKPEITMWRLIEKKLIPPTRMVRYCCDVLKEGGGEGRVVVTGVRWAESARRKNSRQPVEFDRYGSKSKKAKERQQIFLMQDNDEKRRMMESCLTKGKHIVNPIIDWLDEDVWEFIKLRNINYCKLYDEGFKRLGCVGCPLVGKKGMNRDFKRWPQYKKNYEKAFDRMIKERKAKGKEVGWENGKEVMEWWIGK